MIQNQYKLALALLPLAWMWVGCSEQVDPIVIDTRAIPMQMVMRQAPLNKAASSEVVDDKAEMGIFRTTDNGYTPLHNIRYTFALADLQWQSDDGSDPSKTIYLDHRLATLFALFPYQNSNLSGTILQMNGVSRYTSSDNLCLSPRIQASNDRIAAFMVSPIYARMSLLIQNGSTETCIIHSVSFTSLTGKFKTSATLELNSDRPTAPNFSASTDVAVYTFPLTATDSITTHGIAASHSDQTIDMLWIPQFLEGIRIDITIQWQDALQKQTVSKEVSRALLPQLSTAKHHQLRLTLKK